MTPRLNKYIPHEPSIKQQAALWCEHKLELFFGGAARGGKSDWLLMEAAKFADVPDYAAIAFRRTFTDLKLPGALIDRSHEWWDKSDAVWNEQDHMWRFPSGAKIVFGYMEHEEDKNRYQSAEFQCVCFDELTHFTESQYTFMLSRLTRPAGSTLPLRMRAASNPGGPGHEWVKQRFIIEGNEHLERGYIPASVWDNPFVDADAYIRSLGESDPETRARMLHGDWSWRPEGKRFKREWVYGHILDARPKLLRAVRFWDLAAKEPKKGSRPDWTRGCLIGLGPHREIIVCDMRSIQAAPGDVEQFIRLTAEMIDGREVPVFAEQEPGSAGVALMQHYAKDVMPPYIFHGVPSTGSKEIRFAPFAGQAQNGNVFVVAGPWITDWFDELEVFPDSRFKDDQVDATSGAYLALFSKWAGRPSVRVL